MNQQGSQQTPSPVALEGSMLLSVHPQEHPDTEIAQFHPPKAKVCSCISPTEAGSTFDN